jgi:hypothetical protein
MHIGLLNSLLELAHATSQNLDFAHQKGVNVSYGEETITETNLLELRRRHPGVITLRTFGKKAESKNGADWEWHIIGRARRFGMRVQAKRLQQNNILKIPHKVKSTGAEQIDLLIVDAKASGLLPVYCFYASERQRTRWKASVVAGGASPFEFGCLLANARQVRRKMPKSLGDIERDCVPWHYLVDRRRFRLFEVSEPFVRSEGPRLMSLQGIGQFPIPGTATDDGGASPDFPTVDDLNRPDAIFADREGVIEGASGRFDIDQNAKIFEDRRISRLIEIDVRNLPLTEERRFPPPDEYEA